MSTERFLPGLEPTEAELAEAVEVVDYQERVREVLGR